MKKPAVNWRDKEFLNVREVAEILSIHYNTAYNLIHTEIPHIMVGKTYRIASESLAHWIKGEERRNAVWQRTSGRSHA